MNQNATVTDPSTPVLIVRRVTHKVGRGERIEKMPVLITSFAEAPAFITRLNDLRKTNEYIVDENVKTLASVDEYDAALAAIQDAEAKDSAAKAVKHMSAAQIKALEDGGFIAAEKAAELRALLKPKSKKTQTQTAPDSVNNAATETDEDSEMEEELDLDEVEATATA